MDIKILHQEKNFLIIDKPLGLPSAPLYMHDENNAFSQVAKEFPIIKTVEGKKPIEGGLVHRIDTDTRGLLLIACNQNAYDNFTQQQIEGNFKKYYTAFCLDKREDLTRFKTIPITVNSKFRFLGEGRKRVQPVFETSGKAALKKAGRKLYTTVVLSIDKISMPFEKNCVKVTCTIKEGFRHQVRSHLAHLKLFIISDSLYGIVKHDVTMQFFASGLEFNHPESGEALRFSLNTDFK